MCRNPPSAICPTASIYATVTEQAFTIACVPMHYREPPALRGRCSHKRCRGTVLEAGMRIFWAAAATALVVCGAARAEGPQQPPTNGDAAVGVGVICNTSEEARQF